MFDSLEKEGFFYDPIEKEINELYLPNLFTSLKQRVKAYNIAEQLTQVIVHDACLKSKVYEAEENKRRVEEEKKRLALEKAAKEEEEKRKKLEEEKLRKLAEEAALAAEGNGEDKAEDEEEQ